MADTEGLVHILKAPSKDALQQIFKDAFNFRLRPTAPQSFIESTTKGLQISEADAKQLFDAARIIAQEALFEGLEPQRIASLFPVNMQKNGKLATMIYELVPTWKLQSIDEQVSLPRLVDFDWRIDIKTASDSASKMAVPTVLLQMKVRDTPTRTDQQPGESIVNFELTKETLETMLDGLGKIRDQLSSVAK
ncbi:COMM domain-containing protein 9 [Capsaspora owczarzaki ATCC 30864]|nr:COMM domain-containing protein 9 [Capsaspora owczarzaki ATCC 30864]|eukprot:XP_004343058.1 COMM domain-containing protein 9 [Capsaspora owczarzaki ATCC 30864]